MEIHFWNDTQGLYVVVGVEEHNYYILLKIEEGTPVKKRKNLRVNKKNSIIIFLLYPKEFTIGVFFDLVWPGKMYEIKSKMNCRMG